MGTALIYVSNLHRCESSLVARYFGLRLRRERHAEKMMTNILILPFDVFPYVFSYLNIEDKIALASTCQIFRQISVDAKVFRKMDFRRCAISTTQRGTINTFFRDRQLTQHISELNFSNLCMLNWQMDDHLEEFVISICPHLEALHVLNCGMSFQRLHRILKEASKLTALSWSLLDFTSEDIEFIVNSIESCEGIGLKNVKHLHLEINGSLSHIQIAKYLVLSFCRDLEELEIYVWWIGEAYCTDFPLGADQMIPGFPEPSVENELQHLHSLMVEAVGDELLADCLIYDDMLSDFVLSVVRSKSNSTKWKKLWILPAIDISTTHLTDLSLDKIHPHVLQSVEAIAVDAGWSDNAVGELKTLFERIGDNTVRSLHLCLPDETNSIVEFCEPISRVGGCSLKLLRLSIRYEEVRNVAFDSLFSNCSNITELDLLDCCFHEDICQALSKLKHLTKVQLMQCAISSKFTKNQVEISKANLLTFVENCKNIMDLDVWGCGNCHLQFSCCLTNDDLLALANLRNLKSLTLYEIDGITEWTFLKNMSEHCRFLTMLRISAREHFNDSDIPNLMESAKFLKHLAIDVKVPVLGLQVFWNLLSCAKNLERLCIRSCDWELLNVPVAVEILKSLPRLHVLHLHTDDLENVDDFYDEMIRLFKEKQSDRGFSFEIVTGTRRNTYMNHETGHSLTSNKTLPLNVVELCEMNPVLDIPRF